MLMPRLAITWSVPCRLGRSRNTTEAASDCVTANCLGSVSSREGTSYVVWWLRVDRKCFQTTGQQVGSRKAILFSATLRWLYFFCAFGETANAVPAKRADSKRSEST